MIEQNQQNDPVKSPEIQEMIISNRIGQISAELAKRLGIMLCKVPALILIFLFSHKLISNIQITVHVKSCTLVM